jgi:predicted nuclease with TOPRIM domain
MTVSRHNWTPERMVEGDAATGKWVWGQDHDRELSMMRHQRDEAYLKREQKDREYTELYEQLSRTVNERNALQQSLNRMRQERDTLSSRRVAIEGAAYRKLPPQIQAYYTQCWYLDEAGTKKLVEMLEAVSDACLDPTIAKAVSEALNRATTALQGAQA